MDSDLLDWLRHLRGERAASPHTLRAARGDLTSLAEWLGDRPLRSATLSDLRRWLARQAGHGKTRRHVHDRIRIEQHIGLVRLGRAEGRRETGHDVLAVAPGDLELPQLVFA